MLLLTRIIIAIAAIVIVLSYCYTAKMIYELYKRNKNRYYDIFNNRKLLRTYWSYYYK